ncbi:MAG: metallophosphoesterase [Lentisphaerae bacterium]|nr:metallophosphoesterase [Lentisphaerota bacterium]
MNPRRLAALLRFLLPAVLTVLPMVAESATEASSVHRPLRIVFFTDIHTRTEWDTPDALQMAAGAINARKADVVICGGDMITDGYIATPAMAAPRWEAYRAFHDAIRPAPASVVGNHDLVGVEPADGSPPAGDPRADVRAQMGLEQTYRSFDHGGVHFILLDSTEITGDELKYRGHIGPGQMDWLRADLAAVPPETPIVLATHIPLATRFYRDADGRETPPPPNRIVVNRREVLDAFAGHRLRVVLQGHLHVAEHFEQDGIIFITGGAVCGKWWRGSWHGTPEGFGVLTLHPDRIEWQYHTYGWKARRPPGQ